MKKKAKQACRMQEPIVRPMYEADEVTRTKAANAAVMRAAKTLRPLWKAMLRNGWKKWQVEKLMQEAVQHEACFINLLWNRPNPAVTGDRKAGVRCKGVAGSLNQEGG